MGGLALKEIEQEIERLESYLEELKEKLRAADDFDGINAFKLADSEDVWYYDAERKELLREGYTPQSEDAPGEPVWRNEDGTYESESGILKPMSLDELYTKEGEFAGLFNRPFVVYDNWDNDRYIRYYAGWSREDNKPVFFQNGANYDSNIDTKIGMFWEHCYLATEEDIEMYGRRHVEGVTVE